MAIMLALTSLMTGDVRAVLPPEYIEAEKAAAGYHLTVQLITVEQVSRSRTGGLDKGWATGRIIEVVLAPANVSETILHAGDPIAFEAPIWAWSERDLEPPGPYRLYWGPGTPLVILDVWGDFQGKAFVASVFEQQAALDRPDTGGPVEAILERIDRLVTVFVNSSIDTLATEIEHVTGLNLEPTGTGMHTMRADIPAPDGWALDAEFRIAGESHILIVSLGDSNHVRSADVIAWYGPDSEPIPLAPSRNLPANWYLRYTRPWGSILFGFHIAQAHDYTGFLAELVLRRDS